MSNLGLAWTPRIVLGDLDYSFQIPMKPPDYLKGGVGGSETAAAGLPASYSVRRDYMLSVNLRFFEAEWPDVEALVDAMQEHFSAIEFFPDQNNEYAANSCYLESPAMGERWQPTREEHGTVFGLTIVLRSVTGPWSVGYFTDVLDV